MKEIKVALIGYGGIARMHNAGYHELSLYGLPIKLVAVCDKYVEKFSSAAAINIGSDTTPLPKGIHFYTDIDALLAAEDFDMADICLPSFLHADVAVKLLEAGKHVLCEKPMALNSEDSARMLAAKDKSGCHLMIGHCLRFNPAYLYLKECIREETFGKLASLTMNRHSVYPTWGADKWHDDKNKCGGCLIDTHIHDIDMARFLLGEPDRVSAVSLENIPHYQAINTRLHFGDVTVIANGSWDDAYTEDFICDYRARFENATVFFDHNKIIVFPNAEGEEPFTPKLPGNDAYTEEIRQFCATIADDGAVDNPNPPESAHRSLLLCETIADSAARNGEYLPFAAELK